MVRAIEELNQEFEEYIELMRVRANLELVRAIKIFPYGTLLFNEAKTCSICLEDFKDESMVVQLECSKFHIFHEDCIKGMLLNGNLLESNKCPLCRMPFKVREVPLLD